MSKVAYAILFGLCALVAVCWFFLSVILVGTQHNIALFFGVVFQCWSSYGAIGFLRREQPDIYLAMEDRRQPQAVRNSRSHGDFRG